MSETFDEDLFETRLEALKDTQEGIQQMSSWCLQQRAHHKKIVACWLNVFKRVRVEHRLTLFYLANDVIQYSKRKRYEFVESWATALQRATTMVRDEKVKGKILRIFNIWEQREIYNEEYLSDLSGLLNINPPRKSQTHADSSDDFQNVTLITHVRECVELSNTTDKSFKKLPKMPLCNIESFKQQLKDKSHSGDVEKDLERYITYIEAFNKNLQTEIKSRKHVISNSEKAIKFYANQRGEVKVVATAYKNFGNRIKLVKKKLDEITPNLPSPIPSPDINAPSPEPDTDLQLPDEQPPISYSVFKNSINGYSSYLDGNLPFDINDFKRDEHAAKNSSQPIEVIGSRSDDENYATNVEYYKSESISVYSSGSNISIPGLSAMPVSVQSGYTSLARSAQQYSGILPPPNPPLFGGPTNHGGGYTTPMMSGYGNSADGSYHGGNVNNGAAGMQSLMPPPPVPPPGLSGDGGGGGANGGTGNGPAVGNSNDDFNSSWNVNMSWPTSNTAATGNYNPNSLVDTPVSPPHFEREAHSATNAPIEYSEHDSGLGATQDVDHRQLHLPPAFVAGVKLGISKEKSRQLDIDHRNLISLTGSPGTNEQNFPTNKSGDIDYRTITKTLAAGAGLMDSIGSSGASRKPNSPQKSNNSSSSESQKDEGNGSSVGRYDPTDMVVDMDMSDEDLDDIFREVNEQHRVDALEQSRTSAASIDDMLPTVPGTENLNESETTDAASVGLNRPPLLDTPGEYLPSNIWDPAAATSMDAQTQATQPSPQSWNQMSIAWQQNGSAPQGNNGSGGGGGSGRGMCVPPPPRPPFPMPFQYGNEYGAGGGGGGGGEYAGGNGNGTGPGGVMSRGRGRPWLHGPPNTQYRNFPRSPRGGPGGGPPGTYGGSPYFNRGGRGGPGGNMRGPFRGKFRGNSAWI